MPTGKTTYPFRVYPPGINTTVIVKKDESFVKIFTFHFLFLILDRLIMITTCSIRGCLFSSHIKLIHTMCLDIYLTRARKHLSP